MGYSEVAISSGVPLVSDIGKAWFLRIISDSWVRARVDVCSTGLHTTSYIHVLLAKE